MFIAVDLLRRVIGGFQAFRRKFAAFCTISCLLRHVAAFAVFSTLFAASLWGVEAGVEAGVEWPLDLEEVRSLEPLLAFGYRTSDYTLESTDLIPGTRGSEFFTGGQFEKAISDWEVVWSKRPRFEQVDVYLVRAYQYRGMELYVQRRYKDAIAVWNEILEVDPDNEKAVRYISRIRQELEKLEELTG